MSRPLFSIIIPVYDAEQYIAECLESIVSQTMCSYEVVVVDDGSEDASREIVHRFEACYPAIRSIATKHAGVSHARNTGVAAARGEYIVYVDADDVVDSDMLSELASIIRAEAVDCVRYSYRLIGAIKMTDPTPRLMSGLYDEGRYVELMRSFLVSGEPTFVPLLCVRTSIAQRVKFDERFGIMEDKYYYVQLFAELRTVRVIDRQLYSYRQHARSRTHHTRYRLKNAIGVVLCGWAVVRHVNVRRYCNRSDLLSLQLRHMRLSLYYLLPRRISDFVAKIT